MWKKEEVDFMSKIEHFSFSQKKKKKIEHFTYRNERK